MTYCDLCLRLKHFAMVKEHLIELNSGVFIFYDFKIPNMMVTYYPNYEATVRFPVIRDYQSMSQCISSRSAARVAFRRQKRIHYSN